MNDDAIKKVVGRKMRGLPPGDDEALRPTGETCVDCRRKPVAEKGSVAQAHGLCVECSSFRQRSGAWRTRSMF